MAKANIPATSGSERFDNHVARTFIVDDHEMTRDGLRLLIRTDPALNVCGEAAGEAEARRKIDQLKPDLVLIDISLREGDGLELIKWIKKQYAQTKCIVFTTYDEKIYGERAIRAGAHAYVEKADAADAILNAIREVLAGKLYFSGLLIDRILQQLRPGCELAESPLESLSDRELEVFRHIGEGLSTGAIAKKLHISASTVDTYRERLKTKLALKTGPELSRHAMQCALDDKGKKGRTGGRS